MQAQLARGYKGLGMITLLARWYAKNTGKVIDQYRTAAQGVAARVPSGSDVLEIAPGAGYFSVELAKLGSYRIVGLDIQRVIRPHRHGRYAKKAGVNVEFRHGNASSMPFDSDRFDFIYCRAAFKNFSEPIVRWDQRNAHRVLKLSGGTAVISSTCESDAPAGEIDAAVEEMRLDRINAVLTKWIFNHVLLKRGLFAGRDFRRMAAQTPFAVCEIKSVSIGLEVLLHK